MIPQIEAINILKTYNGDNDYILKLKRRVFEKRITLTVNQCNYINKYHLTPVKYVDKIIPIHPYCSTNIATQFGVTTPVNEIYVKKYLSRNEDTLLIWGSIYGRDGYCQEVYIDKKCFKKINPVPPFDFSKYERKPMAHQEVAIRKLLENNKFILADDMGLGKALMVGSLIYTPSGPVKIENLKINDLVIGSDGKPHNVTGVFPQGKKDLYEVIFNDGFSVKCCKEHLWTVSSCNNGNNSKNRNYKPITLSTEQLLDVNSEITIKGNGYNKNKDYKIKTYYKSGKNNKWQIPIVKPIEFDNNSILPINPYLLGLCLGDGHIQQKKVYFTIDKNDYLELFEEFLHKKESNNRNDNIKISIKFDNELVDLKINYTHSDTKFIPTIYKYSSINDRIALLQGLMDTDGYCPRNNQTFQGTEYVTVSEQLAKDVAEIVHTLGGIVRIKTKYGTYKDKNGEKHICKKVYRLNIKLPSGFNPFRLKRKASLYQDPQKYKVGRYIKEIKPCGTDDAFCISVNSPDKLYVAEHGIVTHNTTSAIIAALEGKFERILIVCPATLKLNWKKEIMYFEHESNISIIEGRDFEVKKWTIINYDILKNFHKVKSRYNKDSDFYISPIDQAKFDLVIADECHYVKNLQSDRTKLFNDFAKKIKHRWLLTGTPITNRPIDFYNLLNLCDSPIASNWVDFVKKYCAGKQFYRKGTKQKYWVTSGASNLDSLRVYSAESMLRRTKEESLDLPQKTIKPVYLPLVNAKQYKEYLDEYNSWSKQELNVKLSDHLTKLIKIRKLLSMDKTEFTISTVEDLIENGKKVVVFSCFTDSLHYIHEHFNKQSVLIDGAVSKPNRDLAVESFQNNPNIKVFCANIIAGGVGITLTKGTVVIFNDLDWVPANHSQAEDRCYRIGQTNPVHIIYPIFDETLDVLMYNSLRKKMKVIKTVMGDQLEEENLSFAREIINTMQNELKF